MQSESVFKMFIYRLINICARKGHFLDERYMNKAEQATCDEIAYAYFSFFEDLVSLEMWQNNELLDKEDIDHKCSLDKDNNVFPCIGTMNYRNRKFPVFLDDYGMDAFLEIAEPDGHIMQVSIEVDWYWMVDKILYLEPILGLTQENYEQVMDFLLKEVDGNDIIFEE